MVFQHLYCLVDEENIFQGKTTTSDIWIYGHAVGQSE